MKIDAAYFPTTIEGRCGGVTRQQTGMPKSQADTRTGKSDSDRVKDQRLTLGDLF